MQTAAFGIRTSSSSKSQYRRPFPVTRRVLNRGRYFTFSLRQHWRITAESLRTLRRKSLSRFCFKIAITHPPRLQLFAAHKPFVKADMTFVRVFIAIKHIAPAEHPRVTL